MFEELNFSDQEIIKSNERFFKFFVIFPTIITIFFAVACFVLGIVFAVIEEEFGAILLFWGGGAILCTLTYFFNKVIYSYKVLQIYYLKKNIA